MDAAARFSRVVTMVVCAIVVAACGGSTSSSWEDRAARSSSPDAVPTVAARSVSAGAARTAASPGARRRALAAYGRLPLSFAPNVGQADGRVRYLARVGGFSLLFADAGVDLVFTKPARTAKPLGAFPAPGPPAASVVPTKASRGLALQLRFVGADPGVRVEAGARDGGTLNYLVGDRSRWRRGLQTHRALTYRGLWPGIDLVFRGRGGTLKYEFHVARGADVRAIGLAYARVQRLSVGAGGSLLVGTALGTLKDAPPVSYQRDGSRRVAVESRYTLRGGDSREYGFALGAYDRSRPLVIDPGIAYSTFLGGTDSDEGLRIAVDRQGSAYVTGRTLSADYPSSPGAYDPTQHGPYGSDAFVTKLDASGSALVYSTFVGGTETDEGLSIAVADDGSAYITGQTWSADYPTTVGALDPSAGGVGDAFVTKLSVDGSALAYSTLLGGSGRDTGLDIAVDEGAAYVTGYTASADFPTTPGAVEPTFNGVTDAFVTKLARDGSAIEYATFLGGSGGDAGFGIAVDGEGGAYVTGRTSSTDYPATSDAFDPTFDGGFDAVATKLSPDGSALVYSTLLGGVGLDGGADIAIDECGTAYLTGLTASADYPTTPGALDGSFNGVTDAFVTALRPDGSAPAYSTFLGGTGRDEGTGIAVGDERGAYVTGQTWSADHPTTADAFDSSFNGVADAFVAEVSADGSALVYSAFLGGTDYDAGLAIAIDERGTAAYVTGQTLSADSRQPPAPSMRASTADATPS